MDKKIFETAFVQFDAIWLDVRTQLLSNNNTKHVHSARRINRWKRLPGDQLPEEKRK